MPAARPAASAAPIAMSARSSTTATSAALRNCAAIVPPSFSQSYSLRFAGLPTPTATRRSSVEPCGAITSTVEPDFPEKSATAKARSSALPKSYPLARPRPPPSAKQDDAALLRSGIFGKAYRRSRRHGRPVWNFGLRDCPVRLACRMLVPDIWRFSGVWQDADVAEPCDNPAIRAQPFVNRLHWRFVSRWGGLFGSSDTGAGCAGRGGRIV